MPPSKAVAEFTNVCHLLVATCYVNVAMNRYRSKKKKTLLKKCGLGAAIGSWMHFLCEVAAPVIKEAMCGEPNDTPEYSDCITYSVMPVLMVYDRAEVTVIILFVQILLSNRLILLQLRDEPKKYIRGVRNSLVVLEFLSAVFLGFGIFRIGVILTTAIDLCWTFGIMGLFAYTMKFDSTLRQETSDAIILDTLIRNALYAVGQTLYYVLYLWAGIVSKGAVKFMFHLMTIAAILPALGKSQKVQNAFKSQRDSSTNNSTILRTKAVKNKANSQRKLPLSNRIGKQASSKEVAAAIKQNKKEDNRA